MNESIYSETKCNIPLSIKNYLEKTSEKWVYIKKEDLNLLEKYTEDLYDKGCFLTVSGDFNNNGDEDFAMIIRYTGYEADGYEGYSFPFLVIFNDYKVKRIDPYIYYKKRDAKNESIKTIIYDQFEEGIYAYLEKRIWCEREVIKVVLPEKSTFKIIWDDVKKEYFSITNLDLLDCNTLEVIEKKHQEELKHLTNINTFNGNWKANCEGLGIIKIKDKKVFIEVNSNQIYIEATLEKENDSNYNIYLNKPNDLGAGGMRLNWDNFSKDSIIASFKHSPKSNFLRFNWYGFYDVSIKERVWKQDSDFQLVAEKIRDIKLIKCD